MKETLAMLIVRILRCLKDRIELSRINEKFANRVQGIIFIQFHLFFFFTETLKQIGFIVLAF